MRLKHVTWLFVVGVVLTQTACKRHQLKKSEVFSPTNKPDTVVVVAEKPTVIVPEKPLVIVKPNEVDFNYLKIKSKVDFRSPTLSQSFPANIQVKRDSVIWVSVAVGFEVARGIITPDSAIFLDRLNKNVYKFSFQELSDWFEFDISYALVQSLIVGNMPIYVRDEDDITSSGGFITIKQKIGELNVDNIIDELINKLIRVSARTSKTPSRLIITYENFTDTQNGKVPQRIVTSVENIQKAAENTTIEMEHNKFDFLEKDLKFPFNVPKNYTEVKLKK